MLIVLHTVTAMSLVFENKYMYSALKISAYCNDVLQKTLTGVYKRK